MLSHPLFRNIISILFIFFLTKLTTTYHNSKTGKNKRTSSVWCRIGFLRIFTVAFDMVFKVWLSKGKWFSRGLEIGPAGLEPPAGAINRRKDTVKIWRNPIRQQTDEVPIFSLPLPLLPFNKGYGVYYKSLIRCTLW